MLLSKRKNSIVPALFITLIILREIFSNLSFALTDFTILIPGEATANLVDINKRIHYFYSITLGLLLSWFLLYKLYDTLSVKYLNKRAIHFIFVSSCAGIIILFLELFSAMHYGSLKIIVITQSLFILSSFLKADIKYSHFIFLLIISYSLSFLLREIVLHISLQTPVQFVYLIAINYPIVFTVYYLKTKQQNGFQFFEKLFPLLFIPFASPLSDELFLILNAREIYFVSSIGLYLILVLFLILLTAKRFSGSVKLKKLNIVFIYPFIAFVSLVAFTNYSPFIEQSKDMFEAANPANGIMRICKFGELPIWDFINSHMFSELIFYYIYILFSGYHGIPDFFVYGNLVYLIYYPIIFLFLTFISGNIKRSIFYLLFFPLLEFIFPMIFFMAIPALWLLFQYYKKPTGKNLFWILFYSGFSILWSIDNGIAIIGASLTVLLFLSTSESQKYKMPIKWLIIALLVGLSGIVILFLFNYLSKGQLIQNLRMALEYFGASQAHGYSDISPEKDKWFYNVYFLFPLMTVFFIVYTGYQLKSAEKMTDEKVLFSILFLSVFYIFNFQRGLVRHSLIEDDKFVNSFFYLNTLLIAIYIFRNNKYKWSVFFIGGLLLVVNLRFNYKREQLNLFDNFVRKFSQNEIVPNNGEKLTRWKENQEISQQYYQEFVSFLDQNFKENETFIDFSNSPMLYFYAQRTVPSYFNQYMQNTVTTNLMEINLLQLKKHNVPVVVFSHIPEQWWDNTDGVPNTVRYWKIAQYIYENYIPYRNICGYAIWLHKEYELKNSSFGKPIESVAQNYYLGYYGLALGKENIRGTQKEVSLIGKLKNDSIIFNHIENRIDNYLELLIDNLADTAKTIEIQYDEEINCGIFKVKIKPLSEKIKLIIPLSSQYNWIKSSQHALKIKADKEVCIQNALLKY